MGGLLRLTRRRFGPVVLGILAIIFLIVWGAGHLTGGTSADGRSLVQASPAATAANLPTIAYDRLPSQAHHTLDLISAGGPFPYQHDGIVFQNREGALPPEPRGYYHEYTVVTPGEHDRGARRIIKARDGTLYYTDDHYQTFARIVP